MNSDTLELKGLAVHDVAGSKIGDVIDFYVDARTNEAEWLVVEAGIAGKTPVLVPIDDISRDEDGLVTPYLKEMVMDAPSPESESIDHDVEQALYAHYNLHRELPGRTTERPAFEQDRSLTGDARLRRAAA